MTTKERAFEFLSNKGYAPTTDYIQAYTVQSLMTEFAEDEVNKSAIAGVMPRLFNEKELTEMAYKYSSDRSIGDAEQDSDCMYDYEQGLIAMYKLLRNEV